MAQAFLKSVHPTNLLSFGPDTEPIELRSLNILIGPNGGGKSNFIEVVRLLHFLPDKDPWGSVLATGGVGEWIWKGEWEKNAKALLRADISFGPPHPKEVNGKPAELRLSIELEKYEASFRVYAEQIGFIGINGAIDTSKTWFDRSSTQGRVNLRFARELDLPTSFDLNMDRSILSQLASRSIQASGIGGDLPELFEIAEFLENFDFQQDWEFGVDCPPRDPTPVGQSVSRLEENGYNLAQMLAHYRDNHKAVFEQITEHVKRFYEPTKNLEIRLISTHLQIAVEERGGFSTPAYRLSDGMLRWLAILCILLNPNPAPVTCIDEPELGLHPDAIAILADLLRDASTRTQLIVTTHSPALIDAFSDDPESICVTEKIDGSTVVRRLNRRDLAVWLQDYSLGSLWVSGEIGGSRW